jgi:hypothetical protein
MSLYVKCKVCSGNGHFKCDSCICGICQSKGWLRCSNCEAADYYPRGRVRCGTCAATGQVTKKGLVFSRQEKCPGCGGLKYVACPICKGQNAITCTRCKGSGRNTSCARCGATGTIKCESCAGTGKREGEWLKSLNTLPIDRLGFAHEKRRTELLRLQMELSSYDRELDEFRDWYDTKQREARAFGGEGLERAFIDEGHTDAGIWMARGGTQDRIDEIKREMHAIERVLEARWK